MRGLMPEERDLRQDDAEPRSDQQLEPAVAEKDEAGDEATEGHGDACGHEDVEPLGALKQAGLLDHLRHLLVRLGHGREVRIAGVRLTNRAQRCRGRFDLCDGDDLLLTFGALELWKPKADAQRLPHSSPAHMRLREYIRTP